MLSPSLLKQICLVVAAFLLLNSAMLLSASAETLYYPVDLSEIVNSGNPYSHATSDSPRGAAVLGGVPFNIDPDAKCWHANTAANGGSGAVSVDMPVQIFGATEAYTLINTYWGQSGTYAYLEFFGDGGAYYSKSLYGNTDIRDYINPSLYTNHVNETSTVEMWRENETFYNKEVVVDRQHIVLPDTFADETLTMIRLTDYGGSYTQRAFLSGVTVGAAVPEPSALSLLLFGTIALGGFGILRRR